MTTDDLINKVDQLRAELKPLSVQLEEADILMNNIRYLWGSQDAARLSRLVQQAIPELRMMEDIKKKYGSYLDFVFQARESGK